MDENSLFGRKYKITVSAGGGTVFDVSPLRCVFKIEKTYLSIMNFSTVKIYNANAVLENEIVKEGYNVTIEAGFETAGQYGQIFTGKVVQPIHDKEDNLDFVLTLVCADSGGNEFQSYLSSNFIALTQNRNINQRQIVDTLAKEALVPTEIGRVTSQISDQRLPRGKVLFGEPKKYLQDIAKSNNGSFFINNGQINIGNLSDIPQSGVVTLTPKSGIIGVPQQTQDGVEIRCLLNPSIDLLTTVEIDNSLIRQMEQSPFSYPWILSQDGRYSALKVVHIGDTRGNEWYTEVTGVNSYTRQALLIQPGDNPN